jgi:hypothetical protein
MLGLFSHKPQRFFRAVSISGKPADLGFECEVCRQCVRYGLVPGQTVEHCGTREPVPSTSEWHALPARSLRRGMPELPSGYVLLDTWDNSDGNDWEADSNAASFNPEKMEVPWV